MGPTVWALAGALVVAAVPGLVGLDGAWALLSPVVSVAVAVVGAALAARSLRTWRRHEADLAFRAHLFDHAATPAALYDADGIYVEVNVAFERALGYPRQALIGRSLYEMAPDAAHAGITERLARLRDVTFEPFRMERMYRRADGSTLTVVQSVSRVVGSDGRHYFHAQFFDVTELREGEARLRQFIAALPDPVFIVDSAMRYLDVHLPGDTDPEVTASHLVGRTVAEVLPAEAAALAHDAIREALATSQVVAYQHDLPWQDGSLHRYAVKVAPMGDRVLVVSRDLTHEHEAAMVLEDRESRLRALLAAVPDMLVLFDEDGTYLEVVVPEGRELPHRVESMIGRNVREFAPAIADAVLDAIGTTLRTGALVTFPYTRGEGGEGRHFEGRITAAGPGRALMLSRDVTEDRHRAAALADSLERQRAVFERTAMPTFLSDPAGRLLEVNEAFCSLVGIDADELAGQSAVRLAVPSGRAAVVALAERLQRDEIDFDTVEVGLLRPDGEVRVVVLSMSLVRDADARPRFYVSHLIDVTEQKATHAALQQAVDRQRTVLRALPDTVMLVGPDRVIRDAHVPAGFLPSRSEGTPPLDALIGRSLLDALTPDSASAVLRAIDTAQRTGLGTCEVPFPHPDGGVGWRETRITTSATGELVVLVRDISEATRAMQLLAEREGIFRTLSDASPVIVLQFDGEGRCLYANERWTELTGLSPDETLGDGYLRAFDEEIRHGLVPAVAQQLTDADRFELRSNIRRADGSVAWLDIRGVALPRHGAVGGVIVTAADVTQQVALGREAERLQELLEMSPDYVTIATPAGEVLFANQAASLVVPKGANLDALLTTDSRFRFDEEVLPTVDRNGVWSGELSLHLGAGAIVPVSAIVIAGRDDAGELLHLSIVARDISELKEAQRELAHLASHDALTALPNRALFMDRLSATLAGDADGWGPIAVLFCDLDGFKAVNDELGHDAGDELLRAVAERIRRCVRGTDVAARLGGDEFVVLMPAVQGVEEALAVAHRLVEEVCVPVRIGEHEARVGTSVGIAFATHGEDPDEVLSNADLAMYRAKHAGKGRTVVYDPAWRREPSRS